MKSSTTPPVAGNGSQARDADTHQPGFLRNVLLFLAAPYVALFYAAILPFYVVAVLISRLRGSASAEKTQQ